MTHWFESLKKVILWFVKQGDIRSAKCFTLPTRTATEAHKWYLSISPLSRHARKRTKLVNQITKFGTRLDWFLMYVIQRDMEPAERYHKLASIAAHSNNVEHLGDQIPPSFTNQKSPFFESLERVSHVS